MRADDLLSKCVVRFIFFMVMKCSYLSNAQQTYNHHPDSTVRIFKNYVFQGETLEGGCREHGLTT